MAAPVFYKLLALFAVVAIGWVAGRLKWLGDSDPVYALSSAALYIFIPALLFRTTSRVDFGTLPWGTLLAFFIPVLAAATAVYAWQRQRNRGGELPVAAPSVRAICASFGNTVQVGVPVAAVLFDEAGLAIHISILSVHALILFSFLTGLVETDLARERRRLDPRAAGSAGGVFATTLRQILVHPVVLPVLAGLAWNTTGLALPPVADQLLQSLGAAVVPLCLVLLGVSLAQHGIGGALAGALGLSGVKLLLVPALVWLTARWGFGLSGQPLAVVVMAAALPAGNNALLFSQRYRTLEAETTAMVVVSTIGFAMTGALWLALLQFWS